MSSPDERLSDLLAQRARQGSVQPSLEGVHDAVVGRRTRRHRVIGSAAAGLLVVACLGAAVAASRTEGDTVLVADPDAGTLPDVPLVGVDIEGLSQRQVRTGPFDAEDEPVSEIRS